MNSAHVIQIATALIHRWEGCQLKAYPDPASGGTPWTIGYGATGPTIKDGTVWTKQQADINLALRLCSMFANIQPYIPTGATDNQIGACISLCYNIGMHAFLHSTLMRMWNDEDDIHDVADQFSRWNMANGKVIEGLTNRRMDEQRVFLGGDPA